MCEKIANPCICHFLFVILRAKLHNTMRKVLFFVSILLLLVGCQRPNTVASDISRSNPIMPIRMTSDTMHIVLTDYVPILFGDSLLWKGLQWTMDESLECLNISGKAPIIEEMDIVNRSRTIHAITFFSNAGSFAIPVLPNKPVRQALISLSYEDNKLRVGFFDKVTNPSFEAYIQNTLIDHSLWHEEEDGIWSLDLSAIQAPDFPGRTYLRVFAEDDQFLFNDLLLPLEDGQVITDAAQLNRHDPQAQVLYSLMI